MRLVILELWSIDKNYGIGSHICRLIKIIIHWTPISTPISVEMFTLVDIYKNMPGV
jgi:hypothetical protein